MADAERVVQAADDTERRAPLRRQHVLLHRKAESGERDCTPEPELLPLLDETHVIRAGEEYEHGVRLGGPDIVEVRREVVVAEWRKDFADDLAAGGLHHQL